MTFRHNEAIITANCTKHRNIKLLQSITYYFFMVIGPKPIENNPRQLNILVVHLKAQGQSCRRSSHGFTIKHQNNWRIKAFSNFCRGADTLPAPIVKAHNTLYYCQLSLGGRIGENLYHCIHGHQPGIKVVGRLTTGQPMISRVYIVRSNLVGLNLHALLF